MSALPERLETERLPCLTTLDPQAAASNPVPVDRLRLPEPGFLDQPFILVGNKMGLHLRNRIHGHGHDDKQTGAPEVEWHRHLGNKELGQEADQNKVRGAQGTIIYGW